MVEPYVFISYSREDRKFVERLTAHLREAGIGTWTDRENILPGTGRGRSIRALNKASALVYVASQNSGQSPWMDKPFTAVLTKGGQVVPIIIDDDGPSNLPAPLRLIQWVDFREPFDSAFHSLLDGIRRLQRSSPLGATKPQSKGYVFISYADEDTEFVSDLKLFLKNQGYGYWDYRESERNLQADYTLELEAIIKDAAGTLSVVSPDWKR